MNVLNFLEKKTKTFKRDNQSVIRTEYYLDGVLDLIEYKINDPKQNGKLIKRSVYLNEENKYKINMIVEENSDYQKRIYYITSKDDSSYTKKTVIEYLDHLQYTEEIEYNKNENNKISENSFWKYYGLFTDIYKEIYYNNNETIKESKIKYYIPNKKEYKSIEVDKRTYEKHQMNKILGQLENV